MQIGHFRLLDGDLLSKAPANRQCGSESPPQHPPPTVLGVTVPSPHVPDADGAGKEDSPVVFQIGDDAPTTASVAATGIKTIICQHCSTPQTFVPPPSIDQQTNQAAISRNIQVGSSFSNLPFINVKE